MAKATARLVPGPRAWPSPKGAQLILDLDWAETLEIVRTGKVPEKIVDELMLALLSAQAGRAAWKDAQDDAMHDLVQRHLARGENHG